MTQLARLGEVADVVAGVGFPKDMQGREDAEVPVFKVGDISAAWTNGQRLLRSSRNYLTVDEAASLGRLVPAGSTVFAKIGEALRLNRRAVLAQPSLVDNNVMGLVPRPDVLSPMYLFYFMQTVDLGKLSRATAVPSIRKSDVVDILVPVSTIAQQAVIVAEIEKQVSRLDEAVVNLKRVKANLKRYKAAVLKAAVEGRIIRVAALTPDLAADRDREAQPASYSLPLGWSWATLGDVGQVTGGLTKNPKRATLLHKLPYLRVANVYADDLQLDDIAYIGVADSELKKLRLQKDDLLIVEGNGSPDQIGRVALWNDSIPECVHQNHLIKVRISKALPRWVLNWLLSPQGRAEIERVASSTSGLYTLSTGKVARLPVPFPPLDEQQRIVAEVDRCMTIMQRLNNETEASLYRAERLRSAVLHQAFRIHPASVTE